MIDFISARRLRAKWEGKKRKARKDNQKQANDDALYEAIDRLPVVCSVATGSQSAKTADPKALQAARLAMTAIALMWRTLSKILSDMVIGPDRAFNRVFFAKTID